ncbi:uncharacterized protein LODBEIA_P44750 [Lodderomyces beijingensis]|uniref:Restriction of telomere capping protein 4 n=1 Tax=Lodderomyces beijingensis TaxID=1775926 RepID=A0ABP0ZT21_9ASCO
MRADIRRCRRCKRKRLDDEPLEVRQYKTCAKCRIIERNKKNSRKPLAEETMLYGLKQFREQQSTENYIEEEGLLKDEFFKRYHNKPFNYDLEIARVLNDPNYVPPVITANTEEIMVSSEVASPNGTKYQMTMIDDGAPSRPPSYRVEKPRKPRQPSVKDIRHYLGHDTPAPILMATASQNRALQTQPPSQSLPLPLPLHLPQTSAAQVSDFPAMPFPEDEPNSLLKEFAELGNDDMMVDDLSTEFNPYNYNNVYHDLQKLLLQIIEHKENKVNLKNLVFLKEHDSEFAEKMSCNVQFPNYSHLKLNEKQIRMNLLENLKTLYLDPIIATLGLDFTQKSSNVHDYKSSHTLRSYYQYIDINQNPNETLSFGKIKSSTIGLSYNRDHNIVTIKISFLLDLPRKRRYGRAFKRAVWSILKELGKNGKEEPGHDLETGALVFGRLVSSLPKLEAEVMSELKGITQEEFVNDFANFETAFVHSDVEEEEVEVEAEAQAQVEEGEAQGEEPEIEEENHKDQEHQEEDEMNQEEEEVVVEEEEEKEQEQEQENQAGDENDVLLVTEADDFVLNDDEADGDGEDDGEDNQQTRDGNPSPLEEEQDLNDVALVLKGAVENMERPETKPSFQKEATLEIVDPVFKS